MIFAKAYEAVKQFSQDPTARILYEERLRKIRDQMMREKDAESRTKIEIAKKLLHENIPIQIIEKTTDLSLITIQELKKEIGL